jgi:hypothetical protein
MTKLQKTIIAVLVIVLVFLLLRGVSGATSDKYDGDCTGTETHGRCAPKPEPPFVESAPAPEPPVQAEVPAEAAGLK